MASLYVRSSISSLFGIDQMKSAEYAAIEKQRVAEEQAYRSANKKLPAMERHDSLFDDEEDENAAEKMTVSVDNTQEEPVDIKQFYNRWNVATNPDRPPQLFALRLW